MTQTITTVWLSDNHRRELTVASAIDPAVIAERGYRTMERTGTGTQDGNGVTPREQLRKMGFPSWAIREEYYFPGLWIPQYTPTGQRYPGQFKPFREVPNGDGKRMKYASAKGPSRLDVHPRWSADRGMDDPTLLPAISDPAMRLWITEGVKKADSLTSRGEVTVALAGVFNWRNTHATLADWEDIRLKGREIVVCFDADAITKPQVAKAMARLGKWLKFKGAGKVWYLVVPGECNGSATKGVDDWFAAGGTLKGLEQVLDTRPPQITDTEDKFTDSRLAETLASEVLDGQYVWAAGMDWMSFDGIVWRDVTEVTALETVRTWALENFQTAAARLKLDDRAAGAEVDGWKKVLSLSRQRAVLSMARGVVEHRAEEFDADVDHINTPSGYLDIETGLVRQLGEAEMPTRVMGAAFDPDARSEVWEAFVGRILPDAEVRGFVQRVFGYSLLGKVREHVMPIFTGEGANGKGTLRDALMAAFGDYSLEVDPELLMSSNSPRHLTFLMELRGRRLVFCSETEKGRKFAESTMKRLVGGDPIQANRMRMDPITFDPSHTLIMCTNHLPQVSGDDPAVWRRILVVPFDVVIPVHERDGRLPERLQEADVQAAVLAWVYAGYRAYAVEGLNPPAAVRAKTDDYRSESDAVGRFLTERVQASVSERTTSKELYTAYLEWMRAEGARDVAPLSSREFGKEMTKRIGQAIKSGGVMVYRGVFLLAEDTA